MVKTKIVVENLKTVDSYGNKLTIPNVILTVFKDKKGRAYKTFEVDDLIKTQIRYHKHEIMVLEQSLKYKVK